ncbi:MAG: type II toxin-antitoxin system PemK/MazF family toxin [Acidobacteriaceae bacterium]|nr:type II toxin-antitoxin system PemK/MazF family toxin [Acidobacteriaceae bacterium]MBV9296486.1 type II toxin-antitoxin system PemK/MazF family toxin [Acidobacteriaceae bacterium]MBV9766432.1 type II toxin-antitoxin system PemK/MazF family toxin [Acidobacteriaceae bacterium]
MPLPDIIQGDIFWIDIPQGHTVGSEQYNRRPYIIVSRTALNRSGRTVVGVPLTTTSNPAGQPPWRVTIPAKEIVRDVSFQGDIKDSIVKTDHVRVLDKTRLENRMGKLTNTAFVAVGLALAYLFDLR